MSNKYDDIINLTRPISKKHSQMTREARSAQFAPFAALTGLDEQVKETEKIYYQKSEVDDREIFL